jgi:hypothetical protein
MCTEDDHDNRAPAEVLLKGKTLIEGDESLVFACASIKQCPVIKVGPSPLMDAVRVVLSQQLGQATRQVRVQQDAHDSELRRWRGHQRALGNLQHRDRMFAGHTGKLIKKCVERVARFEVLDKRLNRDPSARENGSAAQAMGGDCDEGVGERHDRFQLTTAKGPVRTNLGDKPKVHGATAWCAVERERRHARLN